MSNLRRFLASPDDSHVQDAVRRLMRGVYYRHEFARRKREVIEASRPVFDLFFGHEYQPCRFLDAHNGTFLTERLIGCFAGAGEDRRKMLNTSLGDFLKKWRVLPVASSAEPFLPYPKEKDGDNDAKNRWQIWKALIRFEMFALARLKTGRPTFLPVMYVGTTSLPDEVRIYEHLDLKSMDHALLIDFGVPYELLRAHFTAIGASIWELHHASDTTEAGDRTTTRASQRLHFEKMDAVLAAYDFESRSEGLPPERLQEKRVEFYRSQLPERPVIYSRIEKQFRDWNKKAREYIDHYEMII